MEKSIDQKRSILSAKSAFGFVVLMGVISLFADMTYESARSLNGPFLSFLGASATAVGVASGAGELLGYGLRFFSGYISDKTRQYWVMTILGYVINLLSVPALALVGRWDIAVGLIFAERVGKAIRNPARDAMLSYAASQTGSGRGFALHEAMDQIGAITGPLLLGGILLAKGSTANPVQSFQGGYALLLIPAILALLVLAYARWQFPNPSTLESKTPRIAVKGFTAPYWWYLAGAGLIAAGYADFPLIAYHFTKTSAVGAGVIPILYAVAMAVDAVAALVMGRWFDRKGLPVLIGAFGLSAFFAPFAFLGSFPVALVGVVLWGIGMGAQESIMKATISNLVPKEKRGTGFGLFHTGFGVFWFLGSAGMGMLYDISPMLIVVFSVLLQLTAVPLFIMAGKSARKSEAG